MCRDRYDFNMFNHHISAQLEIVLALWYGGIQDLREPAAVTELLMDWLTPLLTVDERDRLIAWHLGVRL